MVPRRGRSVSGSPRTAPSSTISTGPRWRVTRPMMGSPCPITTAHMSTSVPACRRASTSTRPTSGPAVGRWRGIRRRDPPRTRRRSPGARRCSSSGRSTATSSGSTSSEAWIRVPCQGERTTRRRSVGAAPPVSGQGPAPRTTAHVETPEPVAFGPYNAGWLAGWRRGWDSNPRRLAPQRFSRPSPSTARTPLQAVDEHRTGGCPTVLSRAGASRAR
jgi:hypothetical protein